jgi:small-conductance mechanosensitive channel
MEHSLYVLRPKAKTSDCPASFRGSTPRIKNGKRTTTATKGYAQKVPEPNGIRRNNRAVQIDAVSIALVVLLAGCLFAYYSTRDSRKPTAAPKNAAASEGSLVDKNLLQTAHRLAPLAATRDEQEQALEAARLTDHELDLAFAAALRDAEAAAAAAVPSTGPLQQLAARIDMLKTRVDAEKKRVDELTKDNSDQLDLAKAQFEVDQDELDDMQQDLARESGDQRGKLQRLLQQHEASQKDADQLLQFGSLGPTGTLSEQIRTWLSLREYHGQLQSAGQEAAAHAQTLLDQHNTLEHQLGGRPDDSGATLAALQQLALRRKTLAGLDQRVQDSKQLGDTYQRWATLVKDRGRGVLHLLLRSLATILAILLVSVVLHRAVRHAFHQPDQRRLHQLGVIAGIALQVLALLLILLILFGPPTQLSTMLGLVTAGLAVVMKDFIVSFFGWFTLMGKNGIHVGDWVEIEGVSGEVIEIGLLKTVLLELGNTTNTGHPTGRRVAFSNSFAMEHHYFNFSTSGQWLWDELQVTVPAAGDPYATAQEIRDIVERETEADAAEAAKDWGRMTRQYGAREFSAQPAVNLRPGVNGLEVNVRYITHAPQRNAVKSRLFHVIVDLLRKTA